MPSTALGPHVVGSRVVVRRIVPGELGPTGGPAFTDVLGICTAWADGLCVIQPAGGEPVAFPTELIVSGKPVPERPSIRHRVSVREAEGHVASLWPSIEVTPLGEWQLRVDRSPGIRLVKRANSTLAVGDPGTDLATATASVREFYAARDRRPMLHVESGSAIEEQLLATGWVALPGGDSHFQLASLASIRRQLGPSDSPSAHVEINGVARGTAVVDRDWLGLHNLWVDPAHRRSGYARRVLSDLVAWGAEQGALTVWLHVETDNAPALALYESIGLRTHHSMRYLTPAGTSPADGSSEPA